MRALTIRQVPAENEDVNGRGIEVVDLATGESTGTLCLGEALEHIAHAWLTAGPPLSHWHSDDRYPMRTPDEWRRQRAESRERRERRAASSEQSDPAGASA